MKMIKCFPEKMDKRQQFALMTTDRSKRMIDLKGTVIAPEAWILYEGEDLNGEAVEILTMTVEGEIFSTISNTFIKKFKQIIEYFGVDTGELVVTSGTSKNGREYISVDVSW